MSKSPSLRRIQADIRELALDPSDRYHAAPLDHDMFEWHFTIRGADGTDFEGGVYHGRIMLPPEYPFKPPHIIFLTPSGRFETNTKVCLSFSAYHPELWQPAWGIRLILEALISFLPTPADGAIGALDWTSAERKKLAQKSIHYACPTCGCKAIDLLPKLKPKSESSSSSSDSGENKPKSRFQKEIEQLQQWQSLEHGKKDDDQKDNATDKEKDEQDELEKTAEQEPSLIEDTQPPAIATTTTNTTPELDTGNTNVTTQPKLDPIVKDIPPPVAPRPETPQPDATNLQEEALNEAPIPPVERPGPRVQLDLPVLQQQLREDNGMLSWMVDPVLHGIIVTLAVLCFLLLRKLQMLTEELETLNEMLEG